MKWGKQFRRLMQKRVLEIACSDAPQDVDAQWAKIRRGWCSDPFSSFRLFHPNDAGSSTCHIFKLYQDGVYIGKAFHGQQDGLK
ncbi:MAG: hypothetical protein DRP64_01675 [Verrucomicrobia bacterium]|nr:MAG: hypothetical protein DRP64_01675 [Verrucomicrobiota bacterium]